jgi:outer membrane receptor protein involved in Fe transport
MDLPERGYDTENGSHQLRIQHAGPLKRRFFTNTRLMVNRTSSMSRSVLEAATVHVIDAFTRGGQQLAGGRRSTLVNLASDLDYVRGIHSVRAGILVDNGWHQSDDQSNYLGTYTFESLEAFDAGTPLSYTRRIGDPNIRYNSLQAGLYIQDDIRVNRSLTLSPGVRYEAQTHVDDVANVGPRFGVTWAPFRNGGTTLRGSAGIFND